METRNSIPLLNSETDPDLQKISDEPLFPLKINEAFRNALLLFKSSLPISLSSLSTLITGMISLGFIGNYGSASDLAGASLAITWGYVFYFGILTSINVGFQVIASHLFGATKYRELVFTYRKTLWLLAILSGPLFVVLLSAEGILIWLGLNEEVAVKTGIYLRYSMPALAGNAVFECTKGYLMAQNYFYIQGIIQSATAALHFLWCCLFVDLLAIPLEGAAIAKSITDIGSAVAILLYVKLTGLNSQIESPFWCRDYLSDWLSYLKRTMSIGANLYIFWLTYGISGFIISALNDEYIIGAHGLASTLSNVLFTMPSGNSLAMQTYLGNAVGEGSKNKAQKIVFAGFSLNAIFSLFNFCIMLFGNQFIANFYTSEKITQEILKEMILIYMFIHLPDTFGEHLCGVLRTVGKEREVLMSCIICSVIIGLSCQWIFGVTLDYSYVGIWLGLGLGIYLLCSSLAVKLYFLNWDESIEEVKQQLKKENKRREKETLIELKESI